MSRPMGRPRPYEAVAPPARRNDGFQRTASVGSRRDYEREDDRRDYDRPYDRHDPGRPYYPSEIKRHSSYDRRMDDVQAIKRPPSRERAPERVFANEDEEIAFLVKEERKVCPPISLQVAPLAQAREFWD